MRISAAGVVMAIVAIGCGELALGSPYPTASCLAVPIGIGTISGDPAAPDRIVLTMRGESLYGPVVTLIDESDDFEFVFDPTLRVVHVDGTEAAREGDLVEIGGQKQAPVADGIMVWCGDLRRR